MICMSGVCHGRPTATGRLTRRSITESVRRAQGHG
jgi:hypothetical protein